MKLFDNNIKILEKGLDAYTQRADLLANNIANINTPNYKRKDIKFESFLQQAIDGNQMSIDGKVTNEKHFTFGNTTSLDTVSPSIIEEKSTTMRNDGNNIDVEKEKVEQTKNNIRYQFATNRISQNFSLLKSVIKTK